ncbi:MAG: Manganese-binding lipoprotein MntA [Chlamydiae bacterium]|nr:Manganese-binding lipoprotein MntA [Chlamydiota bacterium]
MKFRTFFSLSLVVIVLALLVSCSSIQNPSKSKTANNNASIKILCTTGMIRDLVKTIAEEHAEVSTLIKEDLDPHTYELVKGDDEKLISADLVFYNGLGLEHSPNIFRHLKEHPLSFSLGDYICKKAPERILYVNHELDPHIWMDISLWEVGIDLVVNALVELDPKNAVSYQENGERLHSEMKTTHEKIISLLQEIPEENRYLVTCHDAFNYFTRSYLATQSEAKSGTWQKRCKAPEGLSPDSQLSMADIKEVVDHLIKHNIQVIFPESNVNLDSIRKIKDVSKKMGYCLFVAPSALYADSLGRPGEGQDSYLKMLYYNAEIIAKCLKSKEAYES